MKNRWGRKDHNNPGFVATLWVFSFISPENCRIPYASLKRDRLRSQSTQGPRHGWYRISLVLNGMSQYPEWTCTGRMAKTAIVCLCVWEGNPHSLTRKSWHLTSSGFCVPSPPGTHTSKDEALLLWMTTSQGFCSLWFSRGQVGAHLFPGMLFKRY